MGLVTKRSLKFALIAVALVAIAFIGFTAFASDDSDAATTSGSIYDTSHTNIVGTYSIYGDDPSALTLRLDVGSSSYQTIEAVMLDGVPDGITEHITTVEVYGFYKDILTGTTGIITTGDYPANCELYYKGVYGTNGHWVCSLGTLSAPSKTLTLTADPGAVAMQTHSAGSSPFYPYFFIDQVNVVIEGYQSGGDYLLYGFDVINFTANSYNAANANLLYDSKADSVTFGALTAITEGVPFGNLLKNYLKEVHLANVNDVGASTFNGFTLLETADIPNVATVGNNAFKGCIALTSAPFSQLTTIGASAFDGCTALVSAKFGTDASIANNAFNGCTALTTISAENIATIQYSAFKNCSSLCGSFDASNSLIFSRLTAISTSSGAAEQASLSPFFGCSSITSVSLPVINIMGAYSFYGTTGCIALKTLTIGGTLTTIPQEAFRGCIALTSVTFSGSPTEIDTGAFRGCIALTSVSLPNSVTTLGMYAFANTGLTTINTNAVTEIKAYCFNGCTSLASVTLGGSTEIIGSNAFAGCTGLACDIDFPATLVSIGSSAFTGTKLVNVSFADGTTGTSSIGENAFSGCSTIVSLDLGDRVGSIGNGAFNGCANIAGSITIPAKTTVIGNDAFNSCKKITGLVIASGSVLTSIGDSAFYTCSALTGTLTFPATLTSIGTSAFDASDSNQYVKITSVTFTSGTTELSIGDKAFRYCKNITGKVTFPGNTSYIGESAFSGCSSITELEFGSTINDIQLTIGQSAFNNITSIVHPVAFPSGLLSIGQSAFFRCTGITGLSFQSTGILTTIGNNAFSGCSGITGTLSLPDTVKTIGTSAFNGTSISGTLVLPRDLVSIETTPGNYIIPIGNQSFYGTKITAIDFSNCTSLDAIGQSAFYNCSLLRGTLTFPSTLKTIGASAFNGSNSGNAAKFTNVVFNSGLTEIGNNAFQYTLVSDTYTAGTLTLPNTLTRIGDSAFASCSGITALNLGTGLTTIGASAFSGDSNITGPITLPSSLSELGGSAFNNCSGITGIGGAGTVDLSGTSLTTIGNSAFNGCSGLSGPLSLPSTLVTIGQNAFQNCSTLTSINFNGNTVLTTINNNAFYGCSGIVGDLVLPSSLSTLGTSAFNGCSSITSLSFGSNTVLQAISNTAFSGCTSLTGAVALPVNLKTIGSAAFEGTNITSFDIGSAVSTVGSRSLLSYSLETITISASNPNYTVSSDILYTKDMTTLVHCPALRTGDSVTVPSTVQYIGEYAFYKTQNVGSVTFESSTLTIRQYAFAESSLSGTVTLPSTTYRVNYRAFYNCEGITEVVIQSGQADLFADGKEAFFGCSNITSLTIPMTVMLVIQNGSNYNLVFPAGSAISSYTFTGVQSDLPSGYYQTNNTRMPWYFTNVASGPAISVTFDGVQRVDAYMFNNAGCIDTVDLGDDMISFGEHAFYNCSNMKTLIISPTIGAINPTSLIFSGCTKVENLTIPIDKDVRLGVVFNSSLRVLNLTSGSSGTGVDYTDSTSAELPWANSSNYIVNFVDDGISTIGAYMKLSASGNVVIPMSVTTVKEYAFSGSPMTGLTLQGVTTLGDRAFGSCSNLRTLTLPNSLETVTGSPFYGCSVLETVYLPITLNYSGSMFANCLALRNFTFTPGSNGIGYNYTTGNYNQTPWYALCGTVNFNVVFESGVRKIGTYMFYDCVGFSPEYGYRGLNGAIEFPATVNEIGAHAFYNCLNVNSLSITGNSITLGDGAFENCKGIRTLTYPLTSDSVINQSAPVFKDCDGITSITFVGVGPGYNYDTDTYKLTPWYYSRGNALTITIGDGISSIGANTFRGCTRLSGTIDLGDNIVAIGAHAFEGDANITTLILEAQSITIGDSAFKGCVGITALTIDISINAVGSTANSIFEGCTGLTSLTLRGGGNGNGYDYSEEEAVLTPWYMTLNEFTAVFDSGVKKIGTNMFSGCTGLTEAINSPSIRIVSDNAFKGCTGLSGFTAPAMITSGVSAFEGCTYLSTFSAPLLATVTDSMFLNCTNLTEATLTACTRVDDHAFENSGIRNVNAASGVSLPDVVYVGNYAFARSKVVTVTLGNESSSYTFFGDYVFLECPNLTEANINGTLASLPYNTFRSATTSTSFNSQLRTVRANKVGTFAAHMENFRNLTDVHMTSVTSLAADTPGAQGQFMNCEALHTVEVSPYSVLLPHSAFRGCVSLTGWDSVSGTGIDLTNLRLEKGYEFYGCTSLDDITISPAGLGASIPEYAFYNCSSLKKINAPTIANIGQYAFANTGITSICSEAADTANFAGVTVLFEGAFSGCTSLTSVTLSNMTTANASVFSGCTVLASANLPRVTSISQSMFNNCSNLSSVTAPMALTVAEKAFYNCSNLVTISLPVVTRVGNITYTDDNAEDYIAYSVFYGCPRLESVTMPAITSVGAFAFYSCSALTSFNGTNQLNLDGVTYVGFQAFSGTSSASVTVGSAGSSFIGDYAFSGCSSLKSFIVNGGLSSIGPNALNGCQLIENLVIPISASWVSSYRLPNLDSIRFTMGSNSSGYNYTEENHNTTLWSASTNYSVAFDSGITSIGSWMCLSAAGSVEIPATVKAIGTKAFYEAPLTSVSMSGVQTLGDEAFGGCTALTSAVLPDSLSSFDGSPFNGCTSLASVTLPISFGFVGNMFSGCNALSSFAFSKGSNGNGYAYTGDSYTSTPWYNASSNITVSFVDGVVSIGENMFRGCTRLNGTVSLPSTVTQIGDHAFDGDSNISSLAFAANTLTLGLSAFKDCSGITSLTIPIRVNAVRSAAFPVFEGCTGLRTLVLTGTGAGVNYTESGDSDYTLTPWYQSRSNPTIDVTIGAGISSIGNYMFKDCSALNGRITAEGITSIGNYAFAGCTSITVLEAPLLSTLGTHAFDGDTMLSEVIAANITTIPDYAFYGCTSFTTSNAANITTVGQYAFARSGIKNLTASGSGVDISTATSVGDYAFAWSAVESIVIGSAGVNLAMGDYVLLECPYLITVTIDGKLSALQANTFRSESTTGFTSQLRILTANDTMTFAAMLKDCFPALREVHVRGATSFNAQSSASNGMFMNCIALTTVEFYDAADNRPITLPKSAFEGCINLASANLDHIAVESGREFYGCSSLNNVNLAVATKISKETFYGCSSLNTISAPNVTNIGENAFQTSGVTSITSAMFAKLTKVEDYAFAGCLSLTTFTVSTVTTMGQHVFNGCSGLITVTLDNLGELDTGVFYGCNNLATVTLPKVSRVGILAFYGCMALITIELPMASEIGNISDATYTTMSYYSELSVFYNCTSLTTVSMPQVTAIGAFAFYRCSNLTSFNATGTDEGLFLADVSTIRFAAFSETGFENVVVGKANGTLTKISDYAFYGCSRMKTFTSPSLTGLPAHLFNTDDITASTLVPSLVSISVPKVTAFNSNLHGCTYLTTVDASSALTFCDDAFNGCRGLTTVTLPSTGDNVTLSARMFSGCEKLATINTECVIFSNGLDTPVETFKGCRALVSMTLPRAPAIPGSAFQGCTRLGSITAPLVTAVGTDAFNACTSLTNVSMPIAETIKARAFMGCTALATINADEDIPYLNVAFIENDAFNGCAITSLTLGPNLKSIGARSFAYNPLRNLIIPNSDTNLNLREGVFQGCPLVNVHISSSVVKIYANAFDISGAATTRTSFWFNGTIKDTLFNVNGIVAGSGQTLDIHADRESVARIPTLVSGGYIATDGTVNAIQENAATVAIWNQEGATPVYSSVRAIYGGMVVMPFIRYNDGRLASCPFALYDSSKYIALYASEADYENSKVATTGVAVPMYPIKNESDDNLILVGRTTGGFESTFTVVTDSYNLDVDIVEQTVHYGSVLTIPTFTDPSVQMMGLNLYRVNAMKYQMDVGTVSVYVGYCFATIEMMPEDVTIPVTFIYLGRGTGDAPEEKSVVAQVKIQSPFAVPSEIIDDIVYPAGYSFEGWYTGRDGTGEKATSETRFSGGQHWYGWYKPIQYTITIVSDTPAYQSEFTALGPYVLRITNNSLYYDNNGTTNILMFEARSVTGYSVQSYTDAATGFPITTGETVTDNMTIDLYLQMNMYTLNLEFVDVTGGTSTPIPSSVAFTIDGWTVGTGSTYHSGDSVTDVPFSSLEGTGLLMPQPLHDSYAFSRMLAGSTPLTFSNGYHLTYDKFGDSTSVTIKYEMQTGKYTIRYNMNDDTAAVMTSSNSISVGESFLMPSIGRYAKTGYIYDHIEIRGLPEHYGERDNVTLTDEMVAHATYCVVDVDVMWIKIPYRVDFDLNGFAGDVPASLVNMNVDDVITLPTDQISGNSGYRIASWHWVLGTEKSETFTDNPVMTKAVIDQFSTSDRVLTLQVDWIEKTYTLKVLPNPDDPMDPAAGYIFNNINATFGDFFTFWNNTYARAYMKFVGWQIGTEVYDNASTVRLNASMAAVGDASGNDVISVYMAWNKNEYQVQYNLDGGEGQIPSDDNAYIVNESDFTLAADTGIFYREGYSFQGWKYSKDAVIIYNNLSGKFEPILAANSTNNIVTFYAVWEQKTYKITYDLDMGTAGSFAPSKVFYGDEITISKPTRAGYEFAGWTAEGLTGGALYHSSSGYRSWDGVKTVTTEKFMDLCNIDYETDPEHGTIKMIAHWEQATYTITYDLNGGTGIPAGSQSQISIGERIILPTLRNPDRTGYEYVGWGVDPYNAIPNNTVFTESMAPKSENVLTLYVIWSPVEYKLNYRYTADYDYSTLVVDYDETARVPVLDRPGYTFKGWSVTGANPDTAYYSKDGSAWYRVASAVVDGTYFRNMTATKDGTVTLEGVWEEKSYRLVYNPNGGTGKAPVDSNIYVIGDAIVMQDYNVLAGTNGSKSVVGWSLESSGSSVTVTEFTPGLSEHADATGAVNFYAVWVDGMCTVSVKLEGADASSIPAGWTLNGLSGTYDKLVPYGSSTKDVMADWDNVTISKSGKNFTGWSYTSATITSTVIVTPDFETVNMSVMYIFGGVVGAVAVGMVALVRFKL